MCVRGFGGDLGCTRNVLMHFLTPTTHPKHHLKYSSHFPNTPHTSAHRALSVSQTRPHGSCLQVLCLYSSFGLHPSLTRCLNRWLLSPFRCQFALSLHPKPHWLSHLKQFSIAIIIFISLVSPITSMKIKIPGVLLTNVCPLCKTTPIAQ